MSTPNSSRAISPSSSLRNFDSGRFNEATNISEDCRSSIRSTSRNEDRTSDSSIPFTDYSSSEVVNVSNDRKNSTPSSSNEVHISKTDTNHSPSLSNDYIPRHEDLSPFGAIHISDDHTDPIPPKDIEDPLSKETSIHMEKPSSIPEISEDGIRICLSSTGFCGIIVTEDGKTRILKKDQDDDGWIPMFISLKSGVPVVGMEAFEDYKTNPEAVVFGMFFMQEKFTFFFSDLFKFLGKKYSKINFEENWKFELVPKENEMFLIKLKTLKGDKEFDPELALAIILKSLNMLSEKLLHQTPVELKLDFEVTEDLKVSLKNGCEKVGLVFDQ